MKIFHKIIAILGTVFVIFGIVLVIVGATGGGHILSSEKYDKNTKNITYDNLEKDTKIKNIEIDVDADKIQFVVGNDFSVKGEHTSLDKFKVTNENGTLMIKDTTKSGSGHFGINLEFFDSHIGYGTPKIIITVPRNFVAENVTMKVNAGEVEAKALTTKTLTISMNAGSVDIEHLTVSDNTKIVMNAGSVDVEHYNGKNLDASVNAGKIDMEGYFGGVNVLDCTAGSIDIQANGNYNNYYYKYDTDAGKIKINDELHHGDGTIHEGLKEGFEMKCNVGKIELEVEYLD